ncbi:efflux RND transporter permease subunit [uncultured Algimonas sp.]|uniref:efflux RND transporter permease subunit n=1 Tax=uncultured Algimonas sp. TaxID=1547920 RepID=UPI00260BB37E|nr:efflux RND transporter permease subunit [uncultured Algimonas sp.]
MGNYTIWAFTRRKVVYFVVLAAMALGVAQYFQMPAREDPNLLIRTAAIVAVHPGLSAERMERLVARPLEEQISTIAEIEEVRTTISDSTVLIQVDVLFEYKELDQIWDELSEAIDAARPDLPSTMGPIILDDEFGDVAVITAAITSDDYSLDELYDYAQILRDRMRTVPGTRRVEVLGNIEEKIYVTLRNSDLEAAAVSARDITSALASENLIASGGSIIAADRRYPIEPTGLFDSVDDVRETLIRSRAPDGELRIFRLGDFATVERGFEDPVTRRAYFNEKPALVLSVVMDPDQSAINYSKVASAKLDELIQQLPRGIDIDIITYQADQVRSAVYGVTLNVLQTLVVVLAVVVIFLGFRTGLVVGSIVPIVILVTVAIMSLMGIPLQRMSLATIVLSLGLLVDNGIVVAEHFQRRIGEGSERKAAIRETSEKFALPLLLSSLTTMVFFLPLALAPHDAGEYTLSISQVIVIALGVSWIIAFTLTPILCYFFVKAPTEQAEKNPRLIRRFFIWLEDRYAEALRVLMKAWPAFFAVLAVSFAGGGYLITNTPEKFFPDSDRKQILVYLDLPEGSSTRNTDDAMQTVMAILNDDERYPEIANTVGYVGFGGPRFVLSLEPVEPGPNVGFAVAIVESQDAMQPYIESLREELRAAVPEALLRVNKMFLGPQDPNTIQIQVKGSDVAHLTEIGDEMIRILQSVDGSDYVWSDWYNGRDRLVVDIDPVRARQVGLTPRAIANGLAVLTEGLPVTTLRDDDDRVDIVLRATDSERESVEFLESFLLYPPQAQGGVPLKQVADIRLSNSLGRIERENFVRTLTIEGKNVAVTPQDLMPMIADDIEALRDRLEPGHTIEFDGTIADSRDAQAAIAANAPLALGLILLLLLVQFGKWRNVAIILLILPLSTIGVGIGLTLMGGTFGFMVILGLFTLFGIIVINAIVLIDQIERTLDAAKQSRSDDEDEVHGSPRDVVIDASVRRLQPILTTTITTILGLMPLIIAKDVLFYSLSVAVAFGLGIGTLIALGVVPVLYALFNRVGDTWDEPVKAEEHSSGTEPKGVPV